MIKQIAAAKQGIIVRGFQCDINITTKTRPIADSIIAGTAGAELIWKFVGKPVGRWWYLVGYEDADFDDAKEFAWEEDDLSRPKGFSHRQLREMRGGDDDGAFTSLAVVLEAKQPMTTKGLWSPELNPDNGLMGNSYIQPKHAKTVDLIAVHYATPKGWVRKPLQKTIRI